MLKVIISNKKAKTKYVFLNNPDIEINNKSIQNLLICAKKIKNLGIISPVYKKEKVYRNYENFSFKKKIIIQSFLKNLISKKSI